MSTEQRITTLEEVSQLLIAASRGLNRSVQRLEAFAALSERRREEYERQREEYERQREENERRREENERQREEYQRQRDEEMRELADAVRQSDEAVQALLAFVPVTQAEIVRLDNRIDSIEGA